MNDFKKPQGTLLIRSAFTLSEVLITLGIIGVIASLTIPTLIQKKQDAETVTALKTAYSTLENAYQLAVSRNGTPDYWGLTSSTLQGGKNLYANMFQGIVSPAKICEGTTGCVYQDAYNRNYKKVNGDNGSADNFDNFGGNIYENVVLQNGTTIIMRTYSPNCTQNWGVNKMARGCADIMVDTNGKKPPNQSGTDFFHFVLTRDGVLPFGVQDGLSAHGFDLSCNTASGSGYGCTAWVLQFENLDYKHCTNLSWNGPHTCN